MWPWESRRGPFPKLGWGRSEIVSEAGPSDCLCSSVLLVEGGGFGGRYWPITSKEPGQRKTATRPPWLLWITSPGREETTGELEIAPWVSRDQRGLLRRISKLSGCGRYSLGPAGRMRTPGLKVGRPCFTDWEGHNLLHLSAAFLSPSLFWSLHCQPWKRGG